tara:strand:+ start:244 stop:390 length:147 start_codon:yes stop_codon:yes gene_type:complete
MNTFTILFKNTQGDLKTVELNLQLKSVQDVSDWFEDSFGLRAKSISKS